MVIKIPKGFGDKANKMVDRKFYSNNTGTGKLWIYLCRANR